MHVPGGRLDLDDFLADVEQGDVEGAAAQVEHEDGLVALLVQGVGERGRGRLVDDPQDLEAGDLTGLLAASVLEKASEAAR